MSKRTPADEWQTVKQRFLDTRASLSEEHKRCTRSTYSTTIDQFRKSVESYHPELPFISSISPEDLLNFLDQGVSARRSKQRDRRLAALNADVETIPPSSTTRQHRLNVLSGFFKTAIYLEYTTTNLAQNYSAMSGRRRKDSSHGLRQRRKALTGSEKKSFFEALTTPTPNPWPKEDKRHRNFNRTQPALIARNRLMFILFEATGIRVSGMAGMSLYDIDPEELELTVTEKGNKMRIVPIISGIVTDDDLRNLIHDYLNTHRRRLATGVTGEHLWVNQHGKRLSVNMIQRMCSDAMKKAGFIKPNFGPHLLRHTFATDKLDDGGTLRDVAMVLGHEGLQTITTYDSGEHKAARDRLRKTS